MKKKTPRARTTRLASLGPFSRRRRLPLTTPMLLRHTLEVRWTRSRCYGGVITVTHRECK